MTKVAVFIDFENIRYGLLNTFGAEPDFKQIVDKANQFGRPYLIKAYADFSEHPSDITRQLSIHGIEAINVPVKKSVITKGGNISERIKNSADMALVLDMMIEAYNNQNDSDTTFMLVSGDADFVRVIAQIRNTFHHNIVVCGLPDAISNDLAQAVDGNVILYDVPEIEPTDTKELKTAIVDMVAIGPSPLRYWSLRIIDSWSQDPRQNIKGSAKEKRDAIGELVDEGVLEKYSHTDENNGKQVMATTLNREKAEELGYIAAKA